MRNREIRPLLENRRSQLRRPQTEPRHLAYRVFPGVMSDDFAFQTVQVDELAYLKAVTRREDDGIVALLQLVDDRRKEGHMRRVVQVDPDLSSAGSLRDGGTNRRRDPRRRRGLEHLADD